MVFIAGVSRSQILQFNDNVSKLDNIALRGVFKTFFFPTQAIQYAYVVATEGENIFVTPKAAERAWHWLRLGFSILMQMMWATLILP